MQKLIQKAEHSIVFCCRFLLPVFYGGGGGGGGDANPTGTEVYPGTISLVDFRSCVRAVSLLV
jgi:hypothetical protein